MILRTYPQQTLEMYLSNASSSRGVSGEHVGGRRRPQVHHCRRWNGGMRAGEPPVLRQGELFCLIFQTNTIRAFCSRASVYFHVNPLFSRSSLLHYGTPRTCLLYVGHVGMSDRHGPNVFGPFKPRSLWRVYPALAYRVCCPSSA